VLQVVVVEISRRSLTVECSNVSPSSLIIPPITMIHWHESRPTSTPRNQFKTADIFGIHPLAGTGFEYFIGARKLEERMILKEMLVYSHFLQLKNCKLWKTGS
jgi:hypothetical protein